MPNDPELRKEILDEAHLSKYTVHPGGTKMFKDLQRKYWWNGMKREVAAYVSRCLTCQQIKIEHQRPVVPCRGLRFLSGNGRISRWISW